jgi:hypothetical protein
MKASEQKSSEFLKALYVGSSGSGKTGSLVSLLMAGYKIKMLDMDVGTAALRAYIDKDCPDKIDNFDYISLRDKMKADSQKGAKVSGAPKAYTDAIKYLGKWDDESDPATWGKDTIFVLDTLTLFGRSAYRWAQGMNPTAKDPRQWYAAAQASIQDVIDLLTSKEFGCHVLVLSHIDFVDNSDGTTKGYASSIGKALGPKLPATFDTMILAETRGTGENVKRTITTMPTALIDLKNPKSFNVPKSLPLSTGMATIFEELTK